MHRSGRPDGIFVNRSSLCTHSLRSRAWSCRPPYATCCVSLPPNTFPRLQYVMALFLPAPKAFSIDPCVESSLQLTPAKSSARARVRSEGKWRGLIPLGDHSPQASWGVGGTKPSPATPRSPHQELGGSPRSHGLSAAPVAWSCPQAASPHAHQVDNTP